MRKLIISGISLVVLLSLGGCLKTRAQLKEDGQDETPATATAKPNAVQDVQPQGQYAIDEVKSEITRMNGRMEDLERAQKDAAAAKPADEQTKKMEARLTELETAQANMLEAIKKLQDTSPAADPTELFEKGKKEFGDENWDGVIEPLTGYLKSSKPKNAEDGYFMRGESYFHLKKYKLAIADYSEFPEKYTKSKHMAEALYKIGVAFEALGSQDDAKGFYQLLVDKFPKSSQAKKVKSKLK
jgi:TolA-binding protein